MPRCINAMLPWQAEPNPAYPQPLRSLMTSRRSNTPDPNGASAFWASPAGSQWVSGAFRGLPLSFCFGVVVSVTPLSSELPKVECAKILPRRSVYPNLHNGRTAVLFGPWVSRDRKIEVLLFKKMVSWEEFTTDNARKFFPVPLPLAASEQCPKGSSLSNALLPWPSPSLSPLL